MQKKQPDAEIRLHNEIKEEKERREIAAGRGSQRRKALFRWALIGVVAIYAGVTLAMQQRTISAQKQEAKDLQEQQKQMEQELEFLKEKEAYTGSDAYIERAAREKFGWVKEGEIIFKKQQDAADDSKDKDAQPPASDSVEE